MKHYYNCSGLLARSRQLALFALIWAGGMGAAHAQTFLPANAVNTAGTYTDLGSTGTAITTANTDDANSAATPIGFTFTFNTRPYTDFVLNTNGFLKLGTVAPTGPQFTDGGQSNANGPIHGPDTDLIMPFNQDLGPGTAGNTEYRVATTGTAPNRVCTIQWKNVADKQRATLGAQYENISFQVKLYETTNRVDFVYDAAVAGRAADIAKYIQVGLKGINSTSSILVTKPSASPWSQASFLSQGYSGNAHNISKAFLPDAGRTYRFYVTADNDVAVNEIQGYSSIAVPVTGPITLRAVVRNAGVFSQTGVPVTLTIAGANQYTQTLTINTVSTSNTVVTFSNINLPNIGVNTVTVMVPNDDNNDNNMVQQLVMETSATRSSFIMPGGPLGGNGVGSSTTLSSRALCAKFTASAASNVTAVRAFIVNDPTLVAQGATVFGVVVDVVSGAVLGRSPDYVITTADLGQLHTFNLRATVGPGDYLVGLAQVQQAGGPAFYPLGGQRETPSRTDLYYFANITNPARPVTLVAGGGNGAGTARLMLEAETTLVLATSEALRRAVGVFPNPSATGVFNLDIRGANARQAMGVEVTDMLGQRVYTGSAQDNFRNTVDLSALASGVYSIKVRNGQEYTQQQISIVK